MPWDSLKRNEHFSLFVIVYYVLSYVQLKEVAHKTKSATTVNSKTMKMKTPTAKCKQAPIVDLLSLSTANTKTCLNKNYGEHRKPKSAFNCFRRHRTEKGAQKE